MNSTISQAKKQGQKTRTCRLVTTHAGSVALTIRQQQGTQAPQTDVYYLTPIKSEMGGVAYQLTKHDCTKYDVLLDGEASTCDCLGQTKWGHRHPCKHIAALLILQARGQLPKPVCDVCHGQGGPQTGDADSDGAFC